MMGFTTGNFPPVDLETFLEKPLRERIKVLALHWAEYGFGSPKMIPTTYVVKVLFLYLLVGLSLITWTSDWAKSSIADWITPAAAESPSRSALSSTFFDSCALGTSPNGSAPLPRAKAPSRPSCSPPRISTKASLPLLSGDRHASAAAEPAPETGLVHPAVSSTGARVAPSEL
jgi:hypothetical protein